MNKQKLTTTGWEELVKNMPPPEPLTPEEQLMMDLRKIKEASERVVWWRKDNMERLRDTLNVLEYRFCVRIIIIRYSERHYAKVNIRPMHLLVYEPTDPKMMQHLRQFSNSRKSEIDVGKPIS